MDRPRTLFMKQVMEYTEINTYAYYNSRELYKYIQQRQMKRSINNLNNPMIEKKKLFFLQIVFKNQTIIRWIQF